MELGFIKRLSFGSSLFFFLEVGYSMRFLLELFIIIVLLFTIYGLVSDIREYMTKDQIEETTTTIYMRE